MTFTPASKMAHELSKTGDGYLNCYKSVRNGCLVIKNPNRDPTFVKISSGLVKVDLNTVQTNSGWVHEIKTAFRETRGSENLNPIIFC